MVLASIIFGLIKDFSKGMIKDSGLIKNKHIYCLLTDYGLNYDLSKDYG